MTAIVKKKMKHELIRMKKEEINPQQNTMKFEVEVPLKQLEPSIKIIIIIIIINMHKTKHKERNLAAGCFFVDHLASGKIRKEKKGNISNEGKT